jgi:hypothetical protein
MVLPSRPDPQRRARPAGPAKAATRRGLFARLFGRLFGPRFRQDASRYRAYQSRQTVLRLKAELGGFDNVAGLRARFVALGLEPIESEWSFYLPAGRALEKALPLVRRVYGANVGVKVLKDMQPPEDAIYAASEITPDGRSSRLAPSPTALLRVAGLMHAAGLGPRVHDLVHLRAGDRDLSAYVVDHLPWAAAEPAAYRAFMARLRPVMRGGLLDTLSGNMDTDADFRAPDCNGNLRLDPGVGEPLYVDFHAFTIPDELRLATTFARDALAHAGGDRKRLYQSIPGVIGGRRDTEARAAAIFALFRKANLKLDNRLVFDIGCNTGLMMAEMLAGGALWAHGWDHDVVAQSARRILAALGASRFSVHGESLHHDSDIVGALPPHHRLEADGVLLFLDVEMEVGYPPGITYLPWRFVVFEGAPGTEVGAAWRRLQQSGWMNEGSVLAHALHADDDGEPRPLILARRRLT